MPKKISLLGRTFGRLTVVLEVPMLKPSGKRQIYRFCECSCGGNITTTGYSLISGKTTSCGCYRKECAANLNTGKCGSNAPNYQGGRSLDKDGYVKVLVGKRRYKREHILVMEQHLGRELYADETVHHKNGIRSDNQLSNLELRASNHGAGQSVKDLLQWAKEIQRRYEGVEV